MLDSEAGLVVAFGCEVDAHSRIIGQPFGIERFRFGGGGFLNQGGVEPLCPQGIVTKEFPHFFYRQVESFGGIGREPIAGHPGFAHATFVFIPNRDTLSPPATDIKVVHDVLCDVGVSPRGGFYVVKQF